MINSKKFLCVLKINDEAHFKRSLFTTYILFEINVILFTDSHLGFGPQKND